MGNPVLDAARDNVRSAVITHFYSSSTWMEGNAIDQLDQVATLKGIREIAAFPDLHSGKFGPVGCAILADRIYPHLIGNDIGCGMSVFLLNLSARKIRVEKAAQRMRRLEGLWDGDHKAMIQRACLTPSVHDVALGSIGGGNHFCEIQAVETIYDETAARRRGISKDCALLMVHSGSRSLGTSIFGSVQHQMDGLDKNSVEAGCYLKKHGWAVKWASLNRQIIAERAARSLRSECQLIVDSPHNLVEVSDGLFLHRKGAAKANLPLVPFAGSRDALSFLLEPTAQIKKALNSLAHGAGRKYDRRSMMGRVGNTKSEREKLERTSFGGRVVCEDRQLLMQEAPLAYKNSVSVVNDLASHGLSTSVVSLKPLVTFKKAVVSSRMEKKQKSERLTHRRRNR